MNKESFKKEIKKCHICGAAGHLKAACPSKKRKPFQNKKGPKQAPRQKAPRRVGAFIPLAATDERPKTYWKSEKPKKGGRFRVVGSEFVISINSTTTWMNVLAQLLNPANSQMFPKLHPMAKLWRKYRFNLLEISYYGETAATQPGEFAHYIEPDPASRYFLTEQDVLNNERANSGPAWGHRSSVFLPPDRDWKYISTAGKDPADIRMQNSGIYSAYFKAGVTANVFTGQVFVRYDVEFMDNKPLDNSAVSAISIATQDLTVSSGGTDNPMFGLLNELYNWGYQSDTTVDVDSTTPLIEEVGDPDWSDALVTTGTKLVEWYFNVGADGTTVLTPVPPMKAHLKSRCSQQRSERAWCRSWREGAMVQAPETFTEGIMAYINLADAYTGAAVNPVGSSTPTIVNVGYPSGSAIVDTIAADFEIPAGRTCKLNYHISCFSPSATVRALYGWGADLSNYDPTAIAVAGPVPSFSLEMVARRVKELCDVENAVASDWEEEKTVEVKPTIGRNARPASQK